MNCCPATCVGTNPAGAEGTSGRQKRSQPSPALRLPSSQISWFVSRTPSPQDAREQFVRHEAFGLPEFDAPSSHSSPASTLLSPQKMEMLRQSAPHPNGRSGEWREGSHCSPRSSWIMLSPQKPVSSSHVVVQPSKSRRLPSSHSSSFPTIPSPQILRPATLVISLRQPELHPSPDTLLLSSHSSPTVTVPSPQEPPGPVRSPSRTQVPLHPSPESRLLSSHSSPSSRRPFPQRDVKPSSSWQ